MPQLTDRFGPIQQQVVLNGSGNGQVTFQPNGSNARITNLFVKVSTTVNQAQCFMYKGQVADSTLIQNTNSGSTGAAAQGAIDLMDGETLFVVWRGGDVGATATATFVGNTIPFDQIGSSTITWADPIAAGDGSLVYPQIKSPDFQTGVSGWILRRDGSVEFSSAVIRGSLSAGGGTVVVNDLGITVTDNDSTQQYAILRDGGFVARNNPDDGQHVQIFSGGIALTTPNPTPNGNVPDFGILFQGNSSAGGVDRPFTTIHSNGVSGRDEAVITLWGEESDGTPPHIDLTTGSPAGYVDVSDRIVNNTTGLDFASSQLFSLNMVVPATAGGPQALALGNTNYPFAFPAGRTLMGDAQIQNANNQSTYWYARWLPVSVSQFNIFFFHPFGAPAGTTLNVNVRVWVI